MSPSPPPRATAVLGAAVRHPTPHAPPTTLHERPLLVGILLIVLVGMLKIVLRQRLSRRHATSLDLVMVLVGFVLLLMMELPLAGHPGWVGALLFVGLAAIYRLLGYFEEPDGE